MYHPPCCSHSFFYIYWGGMKHARPPIVAVVGHIDHGKSKLQQSLRQSDATLSEAGDITQHIGAYELHTTYEGSPRRATIIDTPGHKAFSHIREHGLDLADLALLVVSSEEGWKEQTREAYDVIVAKNIPFIVVFTKIDTPQSSIEQAKQSVLQEQVFLEGLGGSVPWVGVSSVTGEHIDDLIELIFLTTDVYEIIEESTDGSVGILVETDVDPKIGIAGTIIVLSGALERGGHIRAGRSIAPLRIMEDDRGRSVASVSPSAPVRVFGFDSIPPIGQPVFVYSTKKAAAEAVKKEVDFSQETPAVDHVDQKRVIPLVLRSDTSSGLISIEEAIAASAVSGTAFRIIKKDIGVITEEDVRLAATGRNGHIIGFHTTADRRAQQLAENSSIAIHLFPTIYEVTDWAASVSQEQLHSYLLQHPTGTATVIRVFEEQPQQGVYVIGAETVDGSFSLEQLVSVMRDGSSVGTFTITSIEQRNKRCEEVSGSNIQFALRITGKGSVSLGDTLLALPSVQDEA